MAKNATDKPAAESAEAALGGKMVPMPPQMLAARPADKPRADRAPPTEEELRQKLAVQRIGRPIPKTTGPTPGNGSGQVMIAGVGLVDKGAAVPAFLAGPSAEKKEARKLIESVQRDLAQIITTLGRQLPRVKDALDSAVKITGISEIADAEGVNLTKAADVVRELQEALDRAAQ